MRALGFSAKEALGQNPEEPFLNVMAEELRELNSRSGSAPFALKHPCSFFALHFFSEMRGWPEPVFCKLQVKTL